MRVANSHTLTRPITSVATHSKLETNYEYKETVPREPLCHQYQSFSKLSRLICLDLDAVATLDENAHRWSEKGQKYVMVRLAWWWHDFVLLEIAARQHMLHRSPSSAQPDPDLHDIHNLHRTQHGREDGESKQAGP